MNDTKLLSCLVACAVMLAQQVGAGLLQGLAEQLLNVVVKHERADLEEQRESLIQQMSSNKVLLSNLEESLLSNLSSASGNILDNQVSTRFTLDVCSRLVWQLIDVNATNSVVYVVHLEKHLCMFETALPVA